MKKYAFTAIGLAVLMVALSAVFFVGAPNDTSDGKLRVVATLFPLYDAARYIGGEEAEVVLLLPPGVESHAFEPTPGDVVRVNNADIFIYTNSAMEPWAEDMLRGAAGESLSVVNAGEEVVMIPAVFRDEDEPKGAPDPHIWLDFDNMKAMTRNITRAFIARDSGRAQEYELREQEYIRRMEELDRAYAASLSGCASKTIVYGGHYAFGYLARRYGIAHRAAQGLAPDAEPTARDMTRLIDQIRREHIRYVFYEELVSPKIAETIAQETGTAMLLLNAGHNISKEQFESGISFFDIMEMNMENLKKGLICE